MIVKNGLEWKNITIDDFTLISSCPDKIVLPYVGKMWGEFNWEVMKIALSQSTCCDANKVECYEQIVSSVQAEMYFNIQPKRVRPTMYVKITTVCGEELTGKVFIQLNDLELQQVLDKYFVECSGLTNTWRSFYFDQYDRWKSRL